MSIEVITRLIRELIIIPFIIRYYKFQSVSEFSNHPNLPIRLERSWWERIDSKETSWVLHLCLNCARKISVVLSCGTPNNLLPSFARDFPRKSFDHRIMQWILACNSHPLSIIHLESPLIWQSPSPLSFRYRANLTLVFNSLLREQFHGFNERVFLFQFPIKMCIR